MQSSSNYRRAHVISQVNDRGKAATPDLRQALVHYRSLFAELLETEEAVLTRSLEALESGRQARKMEEGA
jgi:hypothetical protein